MSPRLPGLMLVLMRIYDQVSLTRPCTSRRLLKNSHQAAVLERPFVRRSAATPPWRLLRGRRSDSFWTTV